MRIKPHLLYVILTAVNFWILPAVIRNTGMAMVMMLAGLPLITLIIAAVHAWKAGSAIVFAIVTGILFIPAIFLYFNESAWIYAPAYAVIALIGGVVGKSLRSGRGSE